MPPASAWRSRASRRPGPGPPKLRLHRAAARVRRLLWRRGCRGELLARLFAHVCETGGIWPARASALRPTNGPSAAEGTE